MKIAPEMNARLCGAKTVYERLVLAGFDEHLASALAAGFVLQGVHRLYADPEDCAKVDAAFAVEGPLPKRDPFDVMGEEKPLPKRDPFDVTGEEN